MSNLKPYNKFIIFCPICKLPIFNCVGTPPMECNMEHCVDFFQCQKYTDINCKCDKKDVIFILNSTIIQLQIENSSLTNEETFLKYWERQIGGDYANR